MSQTLCHEPLYLTDQNGKTYKAWCRDFFEHEGDHYATLSWEVTDA